MKTEEDEAFDELARKQGAWGGGFKAKQAMAADKLQEPEREALKLALEALEGIPVYRKYGVRISNAIKYIKAALAQPAQEQEEDWGVIAEKQLASIKRDTRASFEDAMVRATHKVMAECEAQPAQEPVAWMFQHEETGRTMCVDAQQVEWGFEKGNPRLKKIAPLYTTLPQRPWVGLTDEELHEICNSYYYGDRELVKLIEAKLKEKNT